MTIYLVDDEAALLRFLTSFLRGQGHRVMAFEDPRRAVGALQEGVDLVISDVVMPEMDGLQLAAAVTERLGNSPPRTLLMSGDPISWSKAALPEANQVIGMLPKPMRLSILQEVIDLVEHGRYRCPGDFTSFCEHHHAIHTAACGNAETTTERAPLCQTPSYSRCPHYAGGCGRRVREWIRDLTEASFCTA